MRILITLTLFFYCCLCCHGNEGLPQNPPDSILPRGERFFTNRWVHSTYIGLPLVVGGLMQVHHNRMFRHYRNTSVPRFKVKADDYLQYSPAIVMVGLKAAGVKGRSPIGKMLVADAFSTALMAAGVNGMKYTVRLMRPDGSSRNSFPSGHTATAFLTATLLHKEYGKRYPWLSISGYTLAAGIGGMRMLNNRHWMSDVLAGAGIGVMAGQFGYWLSDLVFPNSPKSFDRTKPYIPEIDNHLSFIGIGAGNYIPLKHHLTTIDGNTWDVHSGGYIALEGAWYWNSHFGVGGQIGQSNILYNKHDDTTTQTDDAYTDATRNISFLPGIYFQQPLIHRLSLQAHINMGGTRWFKTPRKLLKGESYLGFSGMIGASLKLRARTHFSYALSLDYMMGSTPIKELSPVQIIRVGANIGYHF